MVFGVQSSSNRIGYLPIGVHPRAARRSFQALLGFGIVIAIGSLVLVLFHTETWDIVTSHSVIPSAWKGQSSTGGSTYSTPQTLNKGTKGAALDEYDREIILPSATGRVLVTGGGGMIGKQVVRRLLRAGIPTTVLDIIFFDRELADIRAQYPHGDLEFVKGDIRSSDDLERSMKGVKGVIHLAAVSRVMWCLENEPDCTDINVRGTEMVLKAMPPTAWFIQASSREVYGAPDHIPVPEDTPHKPANVYGKSKAAAEEVLAKHIEETKDSNKQKLNAIAVRLSNVYGSEYDHPERLIPAIMRNAISSRPIQMVGGDQDLDMVYVEDIVDGISLAITRLHKNTFGWWSTFGTLETFNLGTKTSTSAMTLIRKTMWLTNSSSPLRILPADNRFPSRYVGSTAKSESVLGYKARVNIDEGLHRLAEAFLTRTIDFLRAKRDSDPYNCDKPRTYSIDDVVKLDGCRGFLSLTQESHGGASLYADWVGAGSNKDGPWNDTAKLHSILNPQLWTIHTRKLDDSTSALRISAEVHNGVHRSWLPFDLFPGNWADLDMSQEFTALVERQTGALKVMFDNKAVYPHPSGPEYNWRLAPVCCQNLTAPWPFFADDPMASNIADSSVTSGQQWNASQMATYCTVMADAEVHAMNRLERLKAASHPIVLEESELPGGRAADWRMRAHDQVCRTSCDHPTYCLDTGNCMCGHASNCAAPTRFPWGKFANMPTLSYPPSSHTDASTAQSEGKTALELQVERSSWANVLNSDARRYLASKPEWPAVTAVRGTDQIEGFKTVNATDFFVLRNDRWGCFSADTVMDRAAHNMSKPYEQDKSMFPDIDTSLRGGLAQVPDGVAADDVVMPFTHDWGHCNNERYDILVQRRWYKPLSDSVKRITSWSPMGDLYSRCYSPDQDVVIPPRTWVQDDLKEAYSNLHNVKPARERSGLVGFKGRAKQIIGGAGQREKVMCSRSPRKEIEVRLTGADKLDSYWQRFKPDYTYVQTINETIFCPLPRGTTGWATRMNDVVYSGCIPVVITDRTHHIWWDVLDWSKFAVFVEEWELDHLEEILLGYSWDEVEQMQTNLMLIRDGFLYPSEGKMDENFQERTPWWYAVHSTWLIRQTKYPV